jgi:amidase
MFDSARSMARAIAARETTAADLLELHLAQWMRVNPAINAVVRTDLPAARARAAERDRMTRAGESLGPLHGVPMTVKDTFDVQGMPAMAGAPEYQRRPARTPDAAVVARLREAGAVIWGKTNTPYLAGDNQTFNEVHGRTNNPFDLDRTPGGSSGGAAAALATGMTPLEIGSDIGGSLRIPAHFCGVAALKPTFGAVPLLGHVPPAPGSLSVRDLNVAGPMARTAGDLKLLFGVISGGPKSARGQGLKGRRIGVWNREDGFPLSQECLEAVELAADAADAADAHVARAKPPINGASLVDLYMQLLLPIMAADMPGPLVKAMEVGRPIVRVLARREPYSRSKWALYSAATHRDWLIADETRQKLKRDMDAFFERWDFLLCPVAPATAFAHVETGDSVTRKLLVDGEPTPYHTFHSWIALATVCHLPSVVVPAPRGPSGLPRGVQIIGPLGADLDVLAVAEALEREMGGFAPPPEEPPGTGAGPSRKRGPAKREARAANRKPKEAKPPRPPKAKLKTPKGKG